MVQSPSQSPLTQGSDASDDHVSRREKILHQFPRAHVTNLGGGTIGPVYLTLTQDDQVLFAEARLHRAPFKHMVIDSPELLKMFKDPSLPVDLNVFDHPWPKFRLEPREALNFDVARLERLQYVRSADKTELMVKGHTYATAIEVTPPEAATRRISQPSISTEVQSTRQSARKGSRTVETGTTEVTDLTLPIMSSRRSPGGYTVVVSGELDNITQASFEAEMAALKEKIFDLLSEDGQRTYEWVLSTGLKRQGKEGEKFRNKVSDTLRDLMRHHGANGRELLALHNQYAEKQRRLEKRWPYHLPHIDDF